MGIPTAGTHEIIQTLSSPTRGADHHRKHLTLTVTLSSMSSKLKRYYGAGHLHFITCSCYRRQPLLGTALHRDLFLTVLEQVRRRYQFVGSG